MASGINQREYHDLNSNLNAAAHITYTKFVFNVTAEHGKEEFYLCFTCQSIQNTFIQFIYFCCLKRQRGLQAFIKDTNNFLGDECGIIS